MKQKPKIRKLPITIAALVVLLASILFVPIPTGRQKDGGTREYRAVTYRVVKWKRLVDEFTVNSDGTLETARTGQYIRTSVYWFSDAHEDTDTLWERETALNDYADFIVWDDPS